MRRTFFSIAILSLFASCGGGSENGDNIDITGSKTLIIQHFDDSCKTPEHTTSQTSVNVEQSGNQVSIKGNIVLWFANSTEIQATRNGSALTLAATGSYSSAGCDVAATFTGTALISKVDVSGTMDGIFTKNPAGCTLPVAFCQDARMIFKM